MAKKSNYGVGGKFLKIIQSMYEKLKSCVRPRTGLTELFQYTRRVRQGCLLSPPLFSLYLNDLLDYLENKGAEDVELWELRLCDLLYADDLILLAENENDLKKQMQRIGNVGSTAKTTTFGVRNDTNPVIISSIISQSLSLI